MRKMSMAAAALLAVLYGCGSGNDVTTATAPPTPVPNVNVDGSWRGTLDQGAFSGTCAAGVYDRVFRQVFPLRLEVAAQQAAGSAQVAATASVSFGASSLGSGGFVGLSERNTVTIDAPQPILLPVLTRNTTTLNCDNGHRVRLSGGTTRLRGDATSSSWSGDYTETIQVSGDETGVLTLGGRFNLSK